MSYYFGNHFWVGEGDGRWGVGELGSGKWEWGMRGGGERVRGGGWRVSGDFGD